MRRRFKGASVDATEAGGEGAATEAGEGPERWTSGRKADVVLPFTMVCKLFRLARSPILATWWPTTLTEAWSTCSPKTDPQRM